MKVTKEQFRKLLRKEIKKVINEQEQWAQDVDVEEGKMHDVLGIPEDEKIVDNYDSGEQLAQDLVDAVGEDEAASMLAFAANVDDEENVLDDALAALKEME